VSQQRGSGRRQHTGEKRNPQLPPGRFPPLSPEEKKVLGVLQQHGGKKLETSLPLQIKIFKLWCAKPRDTLEKSHKGRKCIFKSTSFAMYLLKQSCFLLKIAKNPSSY